jgi:hypothetical protein
VICASAARQTGRDYRQAAARAACNAAQGSARAAMTTVKRQELHLRHDGRFDTL